MKKGRISKTTIVILVTLLLIGLCGCSLASDEGDADVKQADELIGAFVTREPIEKTYASYEWIKPMNAPGHPSDITFEGLEGMLFYGYESMYPEGDSFIWPYYGKNMNVNGNIRETEEGRTFFLSAELYFAPRPDGEYNYFYLNPVYETADREIYVLPGNRNMAAEGATSYHLSFKQESKRTLIDKTELDSYEISVDLHEVYEPLEIWMTQIDENNNIIKKEEYFPEEVWGRIEAEPETAYVLVETKQLLPDGRTVTNREIIDWEGMIVNGYDDEGNEIDEKASEIITYYSVIDGFLAKDWAWIYWPER